MPIYMWVDRVSGKSVEIIRSFDEFENPPTQEEAPDVDCSTAEWVRSIGDKITVSRGPGWQGGKGYWTLLLVGYTCLQLVNYALEI